MLAVVAAFVAPWYYNGALDDWLERSAHLADGVAHVAGMILTGFIAYAIVMAGAWMLNRFAKLPVLSIGNAFGGALIGLAKGAVLIWLVLFIALYFPLTREIRTDLREAQLTGYFTGPDAMIDRALEAIVPPPARDALAPFFERHHV
jgi:hypothetical protein